MVPHPARAGPCGLTQPSTAPSGMMAGDRSDTNDDVLMAAVELARAAAVETAGGRSPWSASTPAPAGDAGPIRRGLGELVTHTFASRLPGYVGWHWAVTLGRVPGEDAVTVDEVVLLPGEPGAARPGLGALARAAAPG